MHLRVNELSKEEKTRAIVSIAVDLEGTHALDILYIAATRLATGDRVYGPLNVLDPKRKWPVERFEEGMDRWMYGLFEDYADVLKASIQEKAAEVPPTDEADRY